MHSSDSTCTVSETGARHDANLSASEKGQVGSVFCYRQENDWYELNWASVVKRRKCGVKQNAVWRHDTSFFTCMTRGKTNDASLSDVQFSFGVMSLFS